jgi:hypothetical protein
VNSKPTRLRGTDIPVVDGPYHGDSVKYGGKRVLVRAKGSFIAGQYVLQSRQRRELKKTPGELRYEAYYQWFGPVMRREQKTA